MLIDTLYTHEKLKDTLDTLNPHGMLIETYEKLTIDTYDMLTKRLDTYDGLIYTLETHQMLINTHDKHDMLTDTLEAH